MPGRTWSSSFHRGGGGAVPKYLYRSTIITEATPCNPTVELNSTDMDQVLRVHSIHSSLCSHLQISTQSTGRTRQLRTDCVWLEISGLRGSWSAPSSNTDELTTDAQKSRLGCGPGHLCLIGQASMLREGPD